MMMPPTSDLALLHLRHLRTLAEARAAVKHNRERRRAHEIPRALNGTATVVA